MPATIYGIKNCNTMKKAFDFLAAHGVEYVFHDYKKTAPDPARLRQQAESVGSLRALINTRGPTWRKLPPEEQARADTDDGALALMQAHPSLIRRPILETAHGQTLIGFDADRWQAALGAR